MKITVLDGYTLNPGDNPWTPVEALGELTVYDRTPTEQIVARSVDADIVLTNKVPLSRSTIEQLPDLKLISVLATGFNLIDLAAARERGIHVSNVPEYSTPSVAQHVFAMLLEFIHRSGVHDQAIRAGQWSSCGDFTFTLSPLFELAGKTMGIYGYGRIGDAVGRLANAFGMKVLAYRRRPSDVPDYGPFEWASESELISRSDVLSLHCPQTPENSQMVNAGFLERMKPNAILINTARGGLIDESALSQALNSGEIAGACLDVVSTEPIDPNNPLLDAPSCLMTPHIAWNTLEARRRLMATTAENIQAFQRSNPIHVVN